MNIEQYLEEFEPRYMESYHQCEQCPALKSSHSQVTLSSPLLGSEPEFSGYLQRAADLACSIYSDSDSPSWSTPPSRPTRVLLDSIETSLSRLLNRRHNSKHKKSTVGNPYYKPSAKSASSIPTLASLNNDYACHQIKKRKISVETDLGSEYELQTSFSSIESFLSLGCGDEQSLTSGGKLDYSPLVHHRQ